MARNRKTIWFALAAIAFVDAALCCAAGLSFSGWAPRLSLTAAIASLGLFYHWQRRDARIVALAHWTVAWIAFSIAGAILTYLAASRGAGWSDEMLVRLDRRLGFDWAHWFVFVNGHVALKLVLAFAYTSLMPQILLSVMHFSWRCREDRSCELLANSILALLLTAVVFALFPAMGPGTAVPELAKLYLVDLTGLHDGTSSSFDVTKLDGIVAFPSFHTALAVLLTYAHRGGVLFCPVAALNAVMLVSVPSEGGHYLSDVLAGAAIAVMAIAAFRATIRGTQLGRIGVMRPARASGRGAAKHLPSSCSSG
jgi:hypothetical protein